jgi:hypothetical protein
LFFLVLLQLLNVLVGLGRLGAHDRRGALNVIETGLHVGAEVNDALGDVAPLIRRLHIALANYLFFLGI